MALKTFGTSATTTLKAIVAGTAATPGSGLIPANVALMMQGIKDDLNVAHPVWPGAFEQSLLYVPNRGVLKVLPGDYVAFDPNGWPILVAANSIAGSGWSHN